ncbi:unnamed protein product [Rhizophagus irregularis]|nr:unnamed protein product [Rhizophagus irregularis]
MSYVDILYVHIYEFRTPIEEIMRSLDDAVRSGKFIGSIIRIDLQPACAELDVGIIPWGAVAEGDWQNSCSGRYELGLTKPGITSPLIGARTVTQLEENLKSLEFKLTPEQVKRLDEASKPAEIPFPNSFVSNYDRFIGKNIEVPRKFEAISTSCNFGRINL